MYLSNSEREALDLIGFTDPEPFTVAERLAVAKSRGVYVPGEESLRHRLKEAMDAMDVSERPYDTVPPVRPGDPEIPLESELAATAVWREMEPLLKQASPETIASVVEELETIIEAAEAPLTVTVTHEEPPADALTTEKVTAAEVRHGGLSDADFASMTKKQIVQFVLERFSVQLDGANLKDDLITQAQVLMDRRLAA